MPFINEQNKKIYITEEGAFQYGVYKLYVGEDSRENESWYLIYSFQDLKKAEKRVKDESTLFASKSWPFKFKVVNHFAGEVA